ncbi:CoA-disulfide reductase [Tepidibacillus fermentans]|uniref:NADPH-dependent 2,4-dienoyl-CoA reductase/sulfur reductase-like enzyme n=1 Tax=Tepidibacillus fermentans TaxID=1281767 RepID=A0A4R3KGE9_9BACI|nr:CoA-disulfide reductase [Tepidibacillus fermentans]TCS82486.1 NADPH-dependent 2,4-dienoyl-CoA reductase/sulfur reductase-like enzyme [Tepidibacillus fermentans]
MSKYVIIGGDAAGMSAATQIRRLQPDAEIVVFEKGEILSYAQCGLPYYIAGLVPTAEDLIARTKEQFEEKYKITIHLKHEVTFIDPVSNHVTALALDNQEEVVTNYDYLLIATGGEAIVPPWKGTDLDGVTVLKTIPDANRILKWLDERKEIQKVVIIGGGYIGLEMAEAFHIRGKEVQIIDIADQLNASFDPEMAEHAKTELEKQGIKVSLQEEVKEIKGEGRVQSVVTDKGEYSADLVVISIGIRPNSEIAKQAGIELGPRNAIRVNSRMQTNIENIYAAGDCATHYHLVKQQDDYIPLGTTANKQGRIAGTNLGGRNAEFKGIVGTAVMKVLDLEMARTGLNEKEAKALNIDYETVTIKSRHHATYYPNAERLFIKLIFKKDDRTLLGGQVVGYAGVDKRIDVLAMAITFGMKIDELQDLDLSYAPPFNGVWDPVQQASRVAEKVK